MLISTEAAPVRIPETSHGKGLPSPQPHHGCLLFYYLSPSGWGEMNSQLFPFTPPQLLGVMNAL